MLVDVVVPVMKFTTLSTTVETESFTVLMMPLDVASVVVVV